MFKQFFEALKRLTTNIDATAQTYAEANALLRDRLGLDEPGLTIDVQPEPEATRSNGNGRAKVLTGGKR